MKKTTLNISTFNQGKVQFYPSGSNYQPTSSAPATAAQFDIHIPSTVGGDWISNSELNPYIIIPLISSSYTGTGFDEELIIRFFTSSHLPEYRRENFNPNGGGWNVNSVSSSLYYTGSNKFSKYRDVLLIPTASGVGTATLLRNTIHDLIIGSSAHNSGMISASKQGNFTSSIYLINAKGKVNPPTVYTGSLASDAGFSINIISTGSGTLNFSENHLLSVNSASLSIGFDEDDPTSIVFTGPTSSLGVSRTNSALLYFSGSGKIGFNTKNPKDDIDFKANSFKIRSTDGTRELRFENDGKLTTKKFSNSEVSESIGSEIILSYTPGTFESPKKAQVGETIGTINYVDESFNALSTLDKYFKSGSVAQISSTVRKVSEFGAAGDLQFKVNVDPSSPQESLLPFITIDPYTYGQTVLFPYGITSTTNIVANSNITASGNISSSGTITSLASTTTTLTVGSRIYATIGGGTGNSVVLNSDGQLYTDEIDAGVWGAAGAVVTAGGEVVAPTATLASTSTLVATTDNAEFFVTLVDGASGAQALETSTKLKQNPSTGKLTVTGDVSASGNIYSDNIEILTHGSARVSTITNTTDYWGPNTQGPFHTSNWNVNTTPESNGDLIFTRLDAQKGFIVPYSCSLVGFDAITRMSSGEDVYTSMSLFTANANDMDLANSSNADSWTASLACTGMSPERKDTNSYLVTASCNVPLAPLSVVFPQVKVDPNAAGDGDDADMTMDISYVIKIKRIK
jgi:hypothetical protein